MMMKKHFNMMMRFNDLKCFMLMLNVIVLSCLPLIHAHVALTYPPARKYDLDFLDNSRTKGPCGMPKGSTRTSFLAGSTTNVSWHLAYPHRGGFRLQLLDHLERPVLDLTPSVGGTDFVRNDVTAQNFEVRFPADFTCIDCTLRLLRQADEWSNGYRFWSCADIDIKNRKEFRETCSGHGKWIAARCKCDRRYYGSRCQFSDECVNDDDCGAQGKCIDLHGTSLPRRQCYCNFGWFGPNCSKKSPIKSKDLDLSSYSTKQLSPDYRIHWRILKEKNEIEIVAVVNGSSWIGLGWRPRQLNATCRNFPLIQQRETPSQALTKSTSGAQPKVPASEPEPASAEPEPEKGAAAPEKEPSAEKEPVKEPSAEGEPEPEKGTAAPEKEPSAEKEPVKEPSAEGEPEPEKGAAAPEKEPSAEGEPTSEPSTEPITTVPAPTVRPQPFRPRIYNKTKRFHAPLRERLTLQNAGNLSKRNIQKRSPVEASSEPEPESSAEPVSEGEPSADKEAEKEPAASEPEPSIAEPDAENGASPEKEPSAESEPSAEHHPSAESEPSAKHHPSAESEPSAEHHPSAESEPSVKHHPSAESEPSAEHHPSAESEPSAEHHPSAESEPSVKHHPSAESEPSAEHHPSAESEPSAEHHPTAEGEPSAEHHPSAESEPSAEYHPTADYKSHEFAPKHDFNAMDCTDIVIGSARNQSSRIFDYYTRDRSTPRQDSFWGGSNDLTATGGFEENGVTTIIFRRKLESKDEADHSILDDLMHVIWARGQEPGKYVHSPPSGLEKEQASIKNFYQPDELKYHGHKMQRGVTQINFFDDGKSMTGKTNATTTNADKSNINVLDNDCEGHWKFPRTCQPDKFNCEYYASWQTIGNGDEFRFRIQTTNTKTWTGIGFSDDERMSQTDAIIGWVDPNGRPFLMDTWVVGYSAPKLDDQQNIYNVSGRIQNGATILEFTRKRETNDKSDLSFTDDHCLYLMFPVVGGRFNAVNKKMSKHEQTPVLTESRICIKSCGRELLENSIMPVENAPSQLAYAVSVKLMNLAESFESPAKGTPEFDSLASQIANSMAGVLGHIPGYHETDVNSFEKENNAVIAKMNVLFDKAAYEKGRVVKNEQSNELREADTSSQDDGKVVEDTIRNSIQSAKLGALTVDPGYLHFRTLEHNIEDDEAKSFFNLSEVRLYTVIGLIAALVFVALLQATCTIYKTSSSSRNQKDKLIPNSAWKDYSANTNYAFDTVDAHMSPDDKQQKRNGSRGMNTTSSSQQTLPLSHAPQMKSHYYNIDNGGRHHQMPPYENGNGYPSGQYANRYGNDRTYSLPRQAAGAVASHSQRYSHQPSYNDGYYTQDRRRNNNTSRSHHQADDSATTAMDKPDFYFMPSQRKYSGEVVRVYVDYNKDMKK